jgi:hypothetical protein
MKIIICGGRDFEDYELLKKVMRDILTAYPITAVVQGGARGADYLARKWAQEFNFPYEQYDADWDKYHKAAGLIRNDLMLHDSNAEVVLAFPGGRGTFDMMQRARRKPGVDLIVVKTKEEGYDVDIEG